MAQIRFVAVFLAGEEDIYVFIDTLGFGEESVVQRVLHVNTGETRVRKALRIIQGSNVTDSPKRPDGSREYLSPSPPSERSWRESSPGTTESSLLSSPPLRRRHSLTSPPDSSPPSSPSLSEATLPQVPNIMKLHSTENVLVKLTPTPRYARVSYLEFYNGGDLGEFRNNCRQLNLTVPAILSLRLVLQLSQALQFMYTRSPAILHCDLHRGNVFLHWPESARMPDFYIGDFGLAKLRHSRLLFEDGENGRSQLTEVEAGQWDKKDILSLLKLAGLFPVKVNAQGKAAALLREVVAELEGVVEQPSGATQPRDLSIVIMLASSLDAGSDEASAEMVALKAVFTDRVSSHALLPLYHGSVEEVLGHHEELHGPFDIAEVSKGPGNPRFVKVVSSEPYHRPAEGDGE